MAKLGNLNARILIDAGTESESGQVEVGRFEIPLVVVTELVDRQRVGVKVTIPDDAVKSALRQWATEMAEALA